MGNLLHKIQLLFVSVITAITGFIYPPKPQIQPPPQPQAQIQPVATPTSEIKIEDAEAETTTTEPEPKEVITKEVMPNENLIIKTHPTPKNSQETNQAPQPPPSTEKITQNFPSQPPEPQCQEGTIYCGGKCWSLCQNNLIFSCNNGVGSCGCSTSSILCNNQCWSPCQTNQTFTCTTTGAVCVTPQPTSQISPQQQMPSQSTLESFNAEMQKLLDQIQQTKIQQEANKQKINSLYYECMTKVTPEELRVLSPEQQRSLREIECSIYKTTKRTEKVYIKWINEYQTEAIINDGMEIYVKLLNGCYSNYFYAGNNVNVLVGGNYIDGIGGDYFFLEDGTKCDIFDGKETK